MRDYVYRNDKDTVRVKIFAVEDGDTKKWDADIFYKGKGGKYVAVETYSKHYDDRFESKEDALVWAHKKVGDLMSIKNVKDMESVTDGWDKKGK